MCGACGVLSGGAEWLERSGNPDGIGADPKETRLAERYRRIRLVNRLLSVTGAILRDFNGKLVLKGPTGQTKLVDDLTHVWLAADTIGLRAVDPLSEDFLHSMEESK